MPVMDATETDWLDARGVIVLGEIQDLQHVLVSLSANTEANQWLEAIPDAQREETRRAVIAELAGSGVRIKQLLLSARGSIPSIK